MGIGFNHNISALRILAGINSSYSAMEKAMEKLSSGLRINHASDDPAGLVISEKMRSRIAELNQEIENTSLTINKYETADSALLQLRGNLTELRTLALAAADVGLNDQTMRDAYQAEADNLAVNFNRLVTDSSFGNQKLLDGSAGSVAMVVRLGGYDLSTSQHAGESLEMIDREVVRLDTAIGEVGAKERYSLESRLNNLRVEAANLTAAESQVRDADFVQVYSDFLRSRLIMQSALSLLSHHSISSQTVLSLLGS